MFFHRERQERQQQSQGRQHTQGQAREAQAGLVSIFFKPINPHTKTWFFKKESNKVDPEINFY